NQLEDPADFISGIDHQRFAGHRIGHNRAVALQHAHGKTDVDQSSLGAFDRGYRFSHLASIASHLASHPRSGPRSWPRKQEGSLDRATVETGWFQAVAASRWPQACQTIISLRILTVSCAMSYYSAHSI